VIVEMHFAVAGGEDGVVGATLQLQMPLRLDRCCGVVIDDLVGVDDVVLVVENDFAGERADVAGVGLLSVLPSERELRSRAAVRAWPQGKSCWLGVVGNVAGLPPPQSDCGEVAACCGLAAATRMRVTH
jgi:hypothetical protein